MGSIYYLMLANILMLFARQQFLISRREKGACFSAFSESWYVGFFHFLAIFISLS